MIQNFASARSFGQSFMIPRAQRRYACQTKARWPGWKTMWSMTGRI
ncbi:hypothetical protein ANACOL_02638 [Anaerotruncus colihominis DSM 17241]|uniref:Uncharacterized protein n=1 Tax=Anaerotruncus colihominis DSM 17241 TaxID=445972 RepID=B0PCX5_9FIRM|nr:hypothetical protein ANACOL_02638 [Anaerotruncus colihominis DSM 17241]